MFGIGMPELILIAIIALFVVGPKRLPDLAKTVGKGLSEFRRATEDATETLKETLHAEEIRSKVDDIKESILRDDDNDAMKKTSYAAEGKNEHHTPVPSHKGQSIP